MPTPLFPSIFSRDSIIKSRELPEAVHQTQVDNSTLDITFVSILVLAASIATLGLAANSEATIVGAMLISPLMRPIMSMAYSVATSDGKLLVRSLVTLLAGIFIALLTAAMVENIFSLYEPTDQILSRIQPSLIDLSVAIAAAAAGALAATRKDISGALPGVAIAVALVPPLCVTGIGISVSSKAIALGSLTLFLTNLVAIVLVAALIFLLEGIGKFRQSIPFLSIVAVSIAGLIYFLFGTQRQLRQEDQAHQVIETYMRESYIRDHIVHPGDLNRVIVMDYPDHVYVFVEMKANPSKFTDVEMAELHKRLSETLEQPINLKVLLVHSNEMSIYSKELPAGPEHEYGVDILMPKKQ